jgi:hypothetical protein
MDFLKLGLRFMPLRKGGGQEIVVELSRTLSRREGGAVR